MWNDRLARWFGCSRASWLTLPRSMMVQMPNEWQEKMAELLEKYDEEFPNSYKFDGEPSVQLRSNGKLIANQGSLLTYHY